MDLDDDQVQDLSMTAFRSSQSESDLREMRASQSSDANSDLSPPAASVIQHPSL